MTKVQKRGKRIAFIILFIVAAIWILPILWGVLTSFKSEAEIQRLGFSFLPKQFTFSNYGKLINNDSAPVFRWFLNSLIIATCSTILNVFVVSFAAYGYTRLHFKGRDVLFTFLLSTMMFPGIVNLIPMFKIVDFLGWTDNFLAVIVPSAAGVFNVFLVRQFMLGIPKELDESALIDGANEFQIFRYIIFPLTKPVLAVVALFSFTGSWNDFLWPSVVMSSVDKLPITPGLQLLQGQYTTYPGIATAGAIFALIPTFILYLFAQKYFLQSMSLQSGIK
ncbi:carbohydrate ABC transporter permease [Schleiferilactobacillus harbinensis]|uniref:carbohydrate ABC transporter permease n=1 Tax=Schleiferilactobacillus harbinensis TaxID=304207 RepID=UPI0039EB8016